MDKYKCKFCGEKGSREELRHHVCNGIQKHYDDDADFLTTLILMDTLESPVSQESPIPPEIERTEIEPGGGEFSGAGAQGDFEVEAPDPARDPGVGDVEGGGL